MTNARTSYRENDARGASAMRLVVLLYEQLVRDLTEALRAFEQNDVELRTHWINHAILVIGHLQSPLDFGKGGKVAQDLDRFYNVLRQNLVQVQFNPSKAGLLQQITDVLALREAWTDVERAEKPAAAATTAVTTTVTTTVTTSAGMDAPIAAGSEPEHARLDWQG